MMEDDLRTAIDAYWKKSDVVYQAQSVWGGSTLSSTKAWKFDVDTLTSIGSPISPFNSAASRAQADPFEMPTARGITTNRVDDKRRSMLGWSSEKDLRDRGIFDSLDILEMINTFNRTYRRLAVSGPHVTPVVASLLAFMKMCRPETHHHNFSTTHHNFCILKSIERLATLKEDPKLPILSKRQVAKKDLLVFKEADQYLSENPFVVISFARALSILRLPLVPSVDRLLACLGSWGKNNAFPRGSFVEKFRLAVETCSVSKKFLPLESKNGLIVRTSPTSHSCVMTLGDLERLLTEGYLEGLKMGNIGSSCTMVVETGQNKFLLECLVADILGVSHNNFTN